MTHFMSSRRRARLPLDGERVPVREFWRHAAEEAFGKVSSHRAPWSQKAGGALLLLGGSQPSGSLAF